MRCLARLVLLTVLAVAATGAQDVGEGHPQWSHRVRFEVPAVSDAGLASVELTPEIFHVARVDLGDLRLFGPEGQTVPYVIRIARGSVERERAVARIYNRSYVPGEKASVTLDFGRDVMKNRIRIKTSGQDFRRRVTVEASNDRTEWRVLRADAYVMSFHGRDGRRDFTSETLDLPRNSYRYLRVTVYNAPRDPERIEIEDVACWRLLRERAETAPVPIKSEAVSLSEDGQRQDVELDLGYRNMPLHEVRLAFDNESFFRRVDVYGRNEKVRTVRRAREEAAPVEKAVEVPWQHAASGALYRYPGDGAPDESLTLGLRGDRYRYLQIRIHNYDDPPLEFLGADVSRLRAYLEFQPRGAGEYTLYLGNPDASAPRYDLNRYADRLRREGVLSLAPGPVAPNPARPSEAGQAGEGYSLMIWLALLAAIAVLGYLILRLIHETGQSPPNEASTGR